MWACYARREVCRKGVKASGGKKREGENGKERKNWVKERECGGNKGEGDSPQSISEFIA